jgi:aryl-alcohol dehydrogenase-like predicted oxidoreductase
MINRRDFLGFTVGAGAALAIAPNLLRALQQPGAKLIQKAIPSTGELVPAVGLSFSNHPGCADHAALTQVLESFYASGGRVYDAAHVNPESEQFHIEAARDLGIQNKLFWSTRGTPPAAAPQAGAAFVNGHIDSLLARLDVAKIDLVMLPAASDPSHLAALKDEKKAGRVRYIGVQTIVGATAYQQVASIMRSEPIDFVGIDYDIINRARVEETILPLALERNIAVMAFFPFGNAGGLSCTGGTSLFARVSGTPLPEWAAEFDARTWAQFFAKYVISHPAVTVARVGTTKVTHMIDNISGGIGRLPDEATRRRMAAFIDAIPLAAPQPGQAPQWPAPVALSAAFLDRYVGEYRMTSGTIMTVRRYGTTLVAKHGADPETVGFARSETRFSLGPNVIDFQIDSADKVSGLIYQQGSSKLTAARIR